MSKVAWENLTINTSWDELPSVNVVRQQKSNMKTSSSAPTSANISRRKNHLRASLSGASDNGSDVVPINTIPRDCIAWQTMSQQLSLQLEQSRRSDLAANRNRAILLGDEHKDHVIVPIETVERKSSCRNSIIADSELKTDEDTIEDTSLIKTDAHIIPLKNLVERFNSDLINGLTNDMVTQHRTTFGQNKLTPSRPPSLIWMFIKQLLIGFNGLLWIATLFAFLSYVSFLYWLFSFGKNKELFVFCRNHLVNPVLIFQV